jgi:hypothetical protein
MSSLKAKSATVISKNKPARIPASHFKNRKTPFFCIAQSYGIFAFSEAYTARLINAKMWGFVTIPSDKIFQFVLRVFQPIRIARWIRL